MKSKDVLVLAFAAIVFVVTGVVGYGALNPKKSSAAKGVTVDVVQQFPAQFDSSALDKLSSPDNINFYSRPDLNSGLNNANYFGAF